MKMMLMLTGYTEYQATCLSPILWSILFLAVLYLAADIVSDFLAMERRRRRQKRIARYDSYRRHHDGN